MQQQPKLWDLPTRTVRRALKGSEDGVCYGPVFTPDGQTLVGWEDKFATFHDLASGESRFVLDAGQTIDCLTLAPDGNVCATGNGNTVMLWDVSMKPWRPAPQRLGHYKFLVLSWNENYVTCREKSGAVSVHMSEIGERFTRIAAGRYGTVISPDGQRTASLKYVFDPNGTGLLRTEFIVRDEVRGQETARLLLPPSHDPCIEFSTDGQTVVTGDAGGTLRLWDATNGTLKAVLEGHTVQTHFLAFTADGKTLVSGTKGGSEPQNKAAPVQLMLWNSATGKLIASIDWPVGNIHCVALSPDGRILAVAGAEGTDPTSFGVFRCWDTATGMTLLSHRGRSERYASLAFSPDGKTLAVGEGDVLSNTVDYNPVGFGVELWDVSTMQHRATLHGHLQAVGFVAFSPDGNTLITRSHDGIKLWEAEPISK
jgi:WD40 repeat protein